MASSNFQRTSSKVWWAQETEESPTNWINRNGSPSSHKSQDSGFSDSEIFPAVANTALSKCQNNENTSKKMFDTDVILKDIKCSDNITPKKNFTENIQEKYSSKKSITISLTDECLKKSNDKKIYERHNPCCRSLPSTPKNYHRNIHLSSKSISQVSSPLHSPKLLHTKRLTLYDDNNETNKPKISPEKLETKSESKVSRSKHHTPKISRNLMNYFPKDINDNVTKDTIASNTDENFQKIQILHSLTLPGTQKLSIKPKLNTTVPLCYNYSLNDNDKCSTNGSLDSLQQCENEASISTGTTSSDSFSYQHDEITDCEKEIELYFPEHTDKLEPPQHTSTPKLYLRTSNSSLRKKIAHQKKFNNFSSTGERYPETNPLLLPQFPPVKCWLNEIEQLYEPECMITLQSKSIANDLAQHVFHLAENFTAPVKNVLKQSKIIGKEFHKIKTQLQRNKLQYIGPLTQSLVGNITEYVLTNMVNTQISNLIDPKKKKNDIHDLLEVISHLRQATTSSSLDVEKLHLLITNLQDMFQCAEYNILSRHIQLLVNTVEEPANHLSLRACLFALTTLALQYEKLSDLVVQAGGPRILLILCVECKASTIRTMALRTIATVCCSSTAIRQLEQAEGIEVLADILSDNTRPEPELSEAISVLTQITAPWIEDNHIIKGLAENIDILITAVTYFLEKTQCCQNLLLCAAALANITFINHCAINSLIRNETVTKLLDAVKSRGPRASVFLKEQTATLIANLSDVPDAREYLANNNAGVALLCFLQIYPNYPQDEAQHNAAQRLQQKSAIALSRLCTNLNVSQQIVELGGVTRLIQLCKEGSERNNSDAVLVACLATLRKIVANCGNEVMDQKDIMELVEPRLLDSFLAYSSQNESYV